MDTDGSGAIGSDELSSAFEVGSQLYTCILDSNITHPHPISDLLWDPVM